MESRTYSINLIDDIVLNASLATEGNMDSLDYIPGSNLLGIVVHQLFAAGDRELAMQVIRDGAVHFGDATIEVDGKASYPMPYAYYMAKLKAKVGDDPIYLHHLIDPDKPIVDDEGKRIQIKQQRSGYLTADGQYLKQVKTNFALKSAHNRDQRRSKEGQMYGFRSIAAGQTFRCAVSGSRAMLDKIDSLLIGHHYIGKSRTAQYGRVEIARVDKVDDIPYFKADYTLVYAASNLCFYDQGQPTYQPSAEQLGVPGGTVIWSKSQIRTSTYSAWNSTRDTTSTERHVINRGSVFYVEGGKPSTSSATLGSYRSEGLGQVLYNPSFLQGSNGAKLSLKINPVSAAELDSKTDKNHQMATSLGNMLMRKRKEQLANYSLAADANQTVNAWKQSSDFKHISSSQWGQIRTYATKAKTIEDLRRVLFEKDTGYLAHGKVYKSHWNDKRCLKELKTKVEAVHTPRLIAKIAAEMGKTKRAKDNKTEDNG